MKKPFVTKISIVALFVGLFCAAMKPPSPGASLSTSRPTPSQRARPDITLISNDGSLTFKIPWQMAQLSATMSNALDFAQPGKLAEPFATNLTNAILRKFVKALAEINRFRKPPGIQLSDRQLVEALSQSLALSKMNFTNLVKLLHAANFWEVPNLLEACSFVIAKKAIEKEIKLHQIKDGLATELREPIAKYYFLLTGNTINDQLQIRKNAFSFSIAYLLEWDRIPKRGLFKNLGQKIGIIDLSNLHINSLEGLQSILKKQDNILISLNLANNQIKEIKTDTFKDVYIGKLILTKNQISNIQSDAFNNAEVDVLYLNNNNITNLSGLNNATIDLLYVVRGNPITKKQLQGPRQQFPNIVFADLI